ncbi:hypothetical protein CBS101457_003110 [Exobasidium rhododendri]|nr:hypothetical protein CBS101457_003110 [Exobasidium rhododendri]
MTWPATVLVDAVFIPIYAILLLMSLFNVIRHGHGRAAGYIFLVIFSLVRLAGNIMLVVAYNQKYDNFYVIEWGFILQSLGYTFFLSATLAFYQRAKNPTSADGVKEKLFKSPARLLGLASIVGLVLLITGYTASPGIFPNSSGATDPNATLDIKAKIGDCIFCAITIIIALLTVTSIRNPPSNVSRTIFLFILLALPFMAVRIGYVTYQSFPKDPLDRTLWSKIVFDYITEVIVVLTYFILGFAMRKTSTTDVETIQEYSSSDQKTQITEEYSKN